ncbi:MAG: CDGSH iron-sulfur domain-containing protein [Bacteriovoracaceae bacterium]
MKGWQKCPYSLNVKAGERLIICQCGKTADPPYCDGSHKGSEQRPCFLNFEQDKVVNICGCLESKSMPYCDGSHSRL